MAANETGQERTEEATPRRKEKAFDEGRIPKSQEFTGAVVLLAGAAALAWGGGTVAADEMTRLLRETAEWIAGNQEMDVEVIRLLRVALTSAVVSVAPLMLGVAALALVANAIQARGVLSAHPLKPKLSHISPLSGFKRLVSAQALFTLVKAIVKLSILATLAFVAFSNAWEEVISLSEHEPGTALLVMRNHTFRLAFVVGAAFLAFSLLDYVFQVHQHNKQLRMTRQEVVQEHKEMEGDPLIKSRIRSIALAMSRKRMFKDVASADVVVTNPTHYAIGLKYDAKASSAPIVVAMGARKLAQRIKAIALASRVPVIENKPLAQALMATAKVGQPIPPAL
jgi:flagellar biosynthetic protein FlhB